MNLLYICSIDENHYRALFKKAKLPTLNLTHCIQKANIVLADPPKFAPLLEDAHRLVWLQSTFSGCDALLDKSKNDYLLTRVSGLFGPLMSEYIFGQLLSLTRHLVIYRQQQAEATWAPLAYQSLQGKTMVILGTGDIGAYLATTAKQFGMKVIGVNRHAKPVLPFDRVVSSKDLSLVLKNADVLVSTLPSTPETIGFLTPERLCECHQALFLSVGRGNVVNTSDLLVAIESGHIRHAVLDVFVHEPLEASDPLWSHPSITVTPHISAHSFPEQIFAIFAGNYQRWMEGENLEHLVDFKKGY